MRKKKSAEPLYVEDTGPCRLAAGVVWVSIVANGRKRPMAVPKEIAWKLLVSAGAVLNRDGKVLPFIRP